jgi:hypothetical protein
VLVLGFLIHVVTAIVPPARWHVRFSPDAGEPIIWSVQDSPLAFAVSESIGRPRSAPREDGPALKSPLPLPYQLTVARPRD